MDLRRRAQTNYAAAATSSPKTPLSDVMTSNSSNPSTPRNRLSFGLHRSPADTPSISSSIPFDWDAARSRRTPPYATPVQNRTKAGRKSLGGAALGTPVKRTVKKKGLVEKIISFPSQVATEIALFPNNVPLPAPSTSAAILGGIMHFIHLCIRVNQIRKVPDSDLGWEDMYREGEGEPWFDWTVPMTIILILISCLNVVYLFSRIKVYRLHHRPEPVPSPNAKFVSAQLDSESFEQPPLSLRILSGAWRAFCISWRFLLGWSSPASTPSVSAKAFRIQELEVWTPGDLETMLFCLYSPAHAFLWMATSSSNWMLMFLIMGLVGAQLNIITRSYKTLLKDKEIIHAEVMHEYNEVFVNPHINPIKRDVAVMTHQSEVVSAWDD